MKLSLLVVEDDPDHVAILEYYLKKCGDRVGEVHLCESAGDAAERLERGGIDVMLLDLTLPDSGMDETVARIPEFARHGAQIVVTSSLDVPDLVDRTVKSGAREFLSKQEITEDTLREVLERLAESEADGASGAADGSPSSKSDGTTRETAIEPIAARQLASTFAHDVNSLVTTITFRATALERHEQLQDCDVASEHLAAITDAARAISAYLRGARAVVLDETNDLALHSIELHEWLVADFRHLIEVMRMVDVSIEPATNLPTVLADDESLAHVFTILATNANRAGERASLRIEPGDDAGSVLVSDDGGAWAGFDPKQFGEAMPRGRNDRATAGLGHFRLSRLMRRMGGSADVVELDEPKGAYAVRLRFQPA